ncbi:MAG: single-stranded-DNA-specific exonuclease RecJ [Eubacteriales bacterium]|nr:single-stranded-DNA-specific exonuclease RecJ [Eubacteriales bacterium]
MRSGKRTWKIEYNIPEPPVCLLDAGYNPLLANILAIKGIHSPEEAKDLFFNDISCVHDPFTIKDMDKAVDRIHRAIRNRERIVVYGDYDVDGITSTCLLTDYLRSKGLDVTPYIPDRNEEGYGLNCGALDSFREMGITLVVTVDCGITAAVEAEHAKTLGIDMIITDHHECRASEVPEACAVIDCKQAEDSYSNPNLAGVGVAFKLACACEGNTETILDRYSDLVAIGTIADVMALTGENRYLVIRGLEKLKDSPRPGLEAMMKLSGIDSSSLSASSIGFTIAPRLNAAGRLGQAISAGDLILSSDSNQASELASQLCDLNKERQKIENEIWSEASSIIENDIPHVPIVLASDKWHQGVIGIAASRLADHYSLPTIMINLTDGMGKGSCRSYGGFNLFEALSACSEHLVSFGGHALAAGLNIREEKIDDFRNALSEYYLNNKPEPQPEITCDLLISDTSLLSEDNVRSLDSLEPYGNGNPKPILCIAGAEILTLQDVGNGRHLKLQISSGGKAFDCIFFGHTAREQRLSEGDIIDIAFTPQINEFRGKTSVQFQVCAIRPHDPEELCRNILEKRCSFRHAALPHIPERPDFVRVWKAIEKDAVIGTDQQSVISKCPDGISPEKYCICLEVFRQAGLLSGKDNVYGATLETVSEKKDLDSTPLMKTLRSY